MSTEHIDTCVKLTMRPGDVLVANVPGSITATQAEAIRARIAEVLPQDVRVLVLSGDVGLTVLSAAA